MTISRRHWLAGAIAAICLRPLAMALSLTGCGGGDDVGADPILRVPLADIPAEGRLELEHGLVAIELRREGDVVRARSMFCSHQFCRVKWREQENNYLCPCDDGLFGADGAVLYGRAERPLRDLEVQVVGTQAWVDTRQVYAAAADSMRS